MTPPTTCTSADGTPLHFEGVRAMGSVRATMLQMELQQRFRNPEDHNVEVVYTFALPWRAVLLDIEATLNGQTLHGSVMARAKARESYEEAVSQGHSGVLLQQNHDQSYTLELGNLLPREACTVTLRYVQVLEPQQRSLRLMLPATLAPRYGDAVADGGFEPHAAPVSDATVAYPFEIQLSLHGPLARASVSSPSHAMTVRPGADGSLLVRLARSAWLDRDFVLVLDDLLDAGHAVMAPDRLAPGVHTVLASFRPALSAPTAGAVALKLLVDCSGSMAGDSIEAARRALSGILRGLAPQDRFSLSRFGTTVEHRCKALWKSTGPARASALRWAETLDADLGGTEMETALTSTFALPHSAPSDVLLITDGEVHAIDAVIESARQARHRVFVVGIGASPAQHHLQRLAAATGGCCEFVAPGEAVEPAVVRMFHRLRGPAITGVRVHWPQGWHVLSATSAPQAVFDGDTVTVFAQLQADTPTTVADASAVTMNTPNAATPAGVVTLWGEAHRADGTTSAGAELLAQAQVQTIDDAPNTLARLAAHGRYLDLKAAIDEVADASELAVRYQLVTADTHFVLVHKRTGSEVATDMPQLRQVPGMLPAGWGGTGSVTYGAAPVSMSMSMAIPSVDSSPSLPNLRRSAGSSGDASAAPIGKRSAVPAQWQLNSPVASFTPTGWSAIAEPTAPAQGLTPAGLAEFLRITPAARWPRRYADLLQIGLDANVVEWLEFVVGAGQDELQVVQAFLASLPTLLSGGDLPPTGAAGNALAAALRQGLEGLQPNGWPARVTDFAEAQFAG